MDRDGPIAAVLAGGLGSRLAHAKSTAMLGGIPLLEHPLRAAVAAGFDAVVVAKPSTPLPPLRHAVVLEPDQPSHPLCGVVAALELALARERSEVLLLACDMPFIGPELLGRLATLPAPAMTVLGGRAQPLPSLCAVDALSALAAALARGRPLREALVSLSPRLIGERELERFGEPETLLFNINDARALHAAEGMLAAMAR